MKKTRMIIDERQHQDLMLIEKRSFYIGLFGSVIVILAQMLIFGFSIKMVAGEYIILLTQAIYFTVACIRKGIWSRCIRPTVKNYLIGGLIGGGCVFIFAILYFIRIIKTSFKYAVLIGLFWFIATALLIMVTYLIAGGIYKRQAAKLEEAEKRLE